MGVSLLLDVSRKSHLRLWDVSNANRSIEDVQEDTDWMNILVHCRDVADRVWHRIRMIFHPS